MHKEIREQPEVLGRVLDEKWRPCAPRHASCERGVSLRDARRPGHLG